MAFVERSATHESPRFRSTPVQSSMNRSIRNALDSIAKDFRERAFHRSPEFGASQPCGPSMIGTLFAVIRPEAAARTKSLRSSCFGALGLQLGFSGNLFGQQQGYPVIDPDAQAGRHWQRTNDGEYQAGKLTFGGQCVVSRKNLVFG